MSNKDEGLTPHMTVHYTNERTVLRIFLQLEKLYREYYDFFQCEIIKQKEIIERLYLLTQRFIILSRSDPCCKYPETYTLSAEEIIINEYEEKLEALRASNNSLKKKVIALQPICNEFYAYYNKLDMGMETPFILGDKFHKPIKHYRDMVFDIFQYFYAGVLKMKVAMHQLDPLNSTAIEHYRPLLTISEEFEEYLQNNFIYCKCLESKAVCPTPKRVCPKTNL